MSESSHRVGTCKKCGERIRFVFCGGKFVAVNPEEKQGYQVHEKVLITEWGAMRKPCTGMDVGYPPHWTTCAASAEFRAELERKRAQRRANLGGGR